MEKCEKEKGKILLEKINKFCEQKDEMINDEEVAIIDTKYIETKLKLMLSKMSVSRKSEYDSWTKIPLMISLIAIMTKLEKHLTAGNISMTVSNAMTLNIMKVSL